MPKLTKRIVDALLPDPLCDVFAWDSELRGFGVRLKPSGASSYLVQYRNAHGATRRMVIGAVGILTPDEARKIARQRLAEVATGKDPSVSRRLARKAITVAEVCDWYVEEAGKGRLRRSNGRPIKETTVALDRGRITRHVKPLLGAAPVASLSVAAIEAFQSAVAAGKTAANRDPGRGGITTGGEGAAARTAAMLNSIFEHAGRKGLIPANPVRGFRKLANQKRTDRLTIDHIRQLGTAMREGHGQNLTGVAAIRVMLLTGFRRREVLGAKASWLLDVGGVKFPDTKTGAQVRPIGRAAMEVLKAQAQEVDKDGWLFPADRGEGHFIGIVKVLDRVCAAAGLNGITPHILRHTFASIAAELGFSELTIAGLLGHSAKSVTAGYVHLDQTLVAAADRVSTAIAAALDDTAGAEVFPSSAWGIGERERAL